MEIGFLIANPYSKVVFGDMQDWSVSFSGKVLVCGKELSWNDNSFTATTLKSWPLNHMAENHPNFFVLYFVLYSVLTKNRKKKFMPSRDEFLESISQALLKPILNSLPCCQWHRRGTSLFIWLAWVLPNIPALNFCLHNQEHFEYLIFEDSI